MLIRVIAHNIENRILDMDIIDGIRERDADVVLLVEGYEGSIDRAFLKSRLTELLPEYNHTLVDYRSKDKRRDEHGYIVLTKKDLGDVEITELDGPYRKFVSVKVAGGEIILVHVDDRSIFSRKAETLWLLGYLGVAGKFTHPPVSQVIMGDFNSTHHTEFIGKVLNFWLVSWFIGLLVALGLEVDPSEARGGRYKGLRLRIGKLVSLARRLRDMTSRRNTTLESFEADGLVDALEPGMVTRPLFKQIGVQLDHILFDERAVSVGYPYGFVGKPSDHNGIAAELQWK